MVCGRPNKYLIKRAGSNETCRTSSISEALLSQFLKLGSSSGSFALSDDMSNTFIMALKGYVDHIKEVFNREAVCEIFRLNKTMFPEKKYIPCMEFCGLEKETVHEMVDTIVKAVDKKVILPTKQLQASVLDLLDQPHEEADVAWDQNQELLEKLQDQALNPPQPTAPAPSAGSAPKSAATKVSDVTGK